MQPAIAKKIPVSVFIIAKNEGDRIAATIDSVKDWVHEVVVVDSGSTDNTVKVAENLGAKSFFNEWYGYGMQKRYAEDQCLKRWLLNLDADEVVTPELAGEIQALFANGEPNISAYVLQIRDLLPGETKLALKSHTNYVVRLYNREKARFSASPVHDTVEVIEGKTQMLKSSLMHYSFRSLTHAIEKMNSYTSAQARDLQQKNIDFPHARLFIEFPISFFKAYFLRGYILRGLRGFIYAMHYAFGRFARIAKYLESRQ